MQQRHARRCAPHALPQPAWVGHEQRVALLRRGAGRWRGRGLGLGRAGRGRRQVQVVKVDRHLGRGGIVAAEHAVRCAAAGRSGDRKTLHFSCVPCSAWETVRTADVCTQQTYSCSEACHPGSRRRASHPRRLFGAELEHHLRCSAGALRRPGRACFKPDFSV